jgi:hypothetical protein
MADKKPKTKTVYKGATPAGILTYAWLDKRDTSEYGKNKFKCSLRLKKGEGKNDEYARVLLDLHKAAKGKRDTAPIKDGDALAEDNEKKENMRGFWLLSAKTNNKPEQIDAKKNPLAATAKSGDWGKLSIGAAEYDTGANKGITLYLNKVQLLERRANDDDGFDEEDDYEADTKKAPTADRTDDDQDDSQDGGDDDF